MKARKLTYQGRTTQGHARLTAPSSSQPGKVNTVLVSADGTHVACDCTACKTSGRAKRGWRTVARADVLGGRVPHACYLLKNAARWAPLAPQIVPEP